MLAPTTSGAKASSPISVTSAVVKPAESERPALDAGRARAAGRSRHCAVPRAGPGPTPPRRSARRRSTLRNTRCPERRSTAGFDLRADGLRDPEDDPADERAPQRAEAADHDRLEREDQLGRAGVGVERRAHREEHAGQRRGRHRDRRRPRVDRARVDADELRGVGVLGGRAHLRPSCVVRRNSCSPPRTRIATARIERAEAGDRELALILPRRRVRRRPAIERVHVRREELLQQVRDHDRAARRWSAAAPAGRRAGCARASSAGAT